ncbi:Hypothetical predicted protein, partial [Podarcis lilfordi]
TLERLGSEDQESTQRRLLEQFELLEDHSRRLTERLHQLQSQAGPEGQQRQQLEA